MSLSHLIRVWLKSRMLRPFLWGLPALLAAVAWLVCLSCLGSWKASKIEAAYAEAARKALTAQDYETARIACRRLVETDAEAKPQPLFDLALALAGLGRDAEASALLGTLAPLDKNGFLPAHLFLARNLLARTNPTPQLILTAERHLKHVLSLDPKSADANAMLGRLYMEMRQWDQANKHLLEVVTARPETALLLAMVCKAQGDDTNMKPWAERAEKFFRKRMQEANKDVPTDRMSRSDALALLGNYTEALWVLEKGWKETGNPLYQAPMGEVCSRWALVLAQSKPVDVAGRLKLILQGLQYAPQSEALQRQLIDVSHAPGPEGQTARDATAKMLAEIKNPVSLNFMLGLDAWQHNDIDKARTHFTLAYEKAPGTPFGANNLAMILTLGDKPDCPRALEIIQTVLKQFPNNPNLRETRGQVLVKMGRWQDAIADLEFALPSLSDTDLTHKALAQAYGGLGMADLAAEHERLAKAKPAQDKTGNPSLPDQK